MTKDKNKILQNLKDADCNPEIISKFFQLEENGKTPEILKLLSSHRKQLVAQLHTNQKQIDCLDYLIYNIEQENRNGTSQQRKIG